MEDPITGDRLDRLAGNRGGCHDALPLQPLGDQVVVAI
jgi:hypothetical protein